MSGPTAVKAVIMSSVLWGLGAVWAAEQQASFAVAITLHAISKPISVAQLCPEGKPLDRVGVSISVSCPARTAQPSAGLTEGSGERKALDASSWPTVVVTF